MITAFGNISSEILGEYGSKLNIGGTSKVLVWDQSVAGAIKSWCEQKYTSYMPAIETASDIDIEAWPYKENAYTHIFAAIETTQRMHLQLLRWIQYSLDYKGIAVLLVQDINSNNSPAIIDFVEKASFERGRVRVLDRHVVKLDGSTEDVKVVLAMKWDMLSA